MRRSQMRSIVATNCRHHGANRLLGSLILLACCTCSVVIPPERLQAQSPNQDSSIVSKQDSPSAKQNTGTVQSDINPANRKIEFESDVEPILAEHCFSCHSHQARTTEGGLTLDSKIGWASGGESGPAIQPGVPEKSLLIKAIRYADADLQMPPDGPLPDEQIDVLVEWIRQGANDPRETETRPTVDTDWWSLKPLEKPTDLMVGHPIDYWINRKLDQEGIRPTEQADRVTLIRRLFIDLLGMQPTPSEVQAFLSDESDYSWEQLVSRTLSSPHYGERWARHWLDVIHFADSHGCEHDVKRDHAWRYRDYVIERFNADVPWDQFIKEQLAADHFYPEHPQLKAALGFLAAGPLELSRAGTAPVAFDYLDRDDMVTQTLAAFMSTTANCARCHHHKFDPISQEDYYSLQAVFAGIGKGDIEFDSNFEVMRKRKEMEALSHAASIADASVLLDPKYSDEVERWALSQSKQVVNWSILDPDLFLSLGGATLTKEPDGTIFASGNLPDQEHYTVTARPSIDQVSAIRLDVFKDERLPENGPGRAGNGNLHLTEIDVQWVDDGGNSPQKIRIERASADFDQEGWTSSQAIDGDEKSGWAIFPRVNESHYIVFELAEPINTSQGGRLAITLKQFYPPKHIIGRFQFSVTDAANGNALVLPSAVRTGITKPPAQRSDEERVAIAAAALTDKAKRELSSLPPMEKVYGVSPWWSHAKKLGAPQSPKVVNLLKRGSFEQPGSEVGPGAIELISHASGRFHLPADSDESRRRAALASWIAHRDNPLTWRSIVNRVWQGHFGRGLVDTPNDFGQMGSRPSHPELLDWLTLWFRDEAKGSLMALHQLILTSETWKRSSLYDTAATGMVSDKDNRLLWRATRRRLDADSYRDSVLRVSGVLDDSVGGPGVEQFLKEQGPQATPKLDYGNYDWGSAGATRRSIYRVVWRGIPDPFMEALDFPDLGILSPKRGNSISALQSLSLYNNAFVLHFSDKLAQCVASEHASVERQVTAVVEGTWLRSPSERELGSFVEFVDQYGLAALCRVMLNSNEFLYVD